MAIRPPPSKPSKVVVTIAKEASKQGLTAYAIAQRSGLSIPTVDRILAGKGSPTIGTLEVIATALDLVIVAEKK